MRVAALAVAALVACSSPETSRPTASAPHASAAGTPSGAAAAGSTSATAGTSKDAIPPPDCRGEPLAPDRLLCDVKYLAGPAFDGRRSASDDEKRAAEFLASELSKMGLPPRTLPFKARGFDSRNVFAVVEPEPGKKKSNAPVILGAHMDHEGVKGGETYWGADDNASGCAVVLGIARTLVTRRADLGRSVAIFFFGAEEMGLYGSEEVAQRFPFADKPFAMINVDMVGRPLSDQVLLRPLSRAIGIEPERSIGVDVASKNTALERIVRAAGEAERHRAVLIDDLPEMIQPEVRNLSRGRGDNWSFERVGVPTIFFSSAESSDYHKPTDTWDTLTPELLAVRARVILRTVVDVSNLPKL